MCFIIIIRVYDNRLREGRENCIMISNQILQNTIEGLKAITRIDLCVMDIEGKVLASTFSNAEDY